MPTSQHHCLCGSEEKQGCFSNVGVTFFSHSLWTPFPSVFLVQTYITLPTSWLQDPLPQILLSLCSLLMGNTRENPGSLVWPLNRAPPPRRKATSCSVG